MTSPRDPEALLAAYLMDGMDVLPDRVADAVLDHVHQTRQWGPSGPRRIAMPRLAFIATGLVVALGVGAAGLFAALGPGEGASSPPSPSGPEASTLAEFPRTTADLIVGASYRATGFSQPLTLTIPDCINEIGSSPACGKFDRITGSIDDEGHTLRIDFSPSDQSITIHDDATVNVDPCEPTAAVQEIPGTPAAVGEWLHGITGLEVEDLADWTLNPARVATGYSVTTGPSCGEVDPAGDPDIVFRPGERLTIWAIPTDTDTILFVEWYGEVADTINVPILIQRVAWLLVWSLGFE